MQSARRARVSSGGWICSRLAAERWQQPPSVRSRRDSLAPDGIAALSRSVPPQDAPRGLLVLHHGRGTDEQDLLPLADVLDPQRQLHVVAPRAPLQLPGLPATTGTSVPRVGYPDPARSRLIRPPCRAPRRAVGAHRPRAGADRARWLLDGHGDELCARASAPTAQRPLGSSRSRDSCPRSRDGSRT